MEISKCYKARYLLICLFVYLIAKQVPGYIVCVSTYVSKHMFSSCILIIATLKMHI